MLEGALPREELAVLEGGPEVAQELLALPFNHIYYTGGQRVGRLKVRLTACCGTLLLGVDRRETSQALVLH